ncbi:4Fe-4S binding protein [Zhaonella formicivorans]|uniref:4Fe-4S binding protein n=1 Tax=Zhaonella formicivorans TaxID=2528593 RepID=UPI0010EAB62C|nr:4Fe-4S binding protein [Zhaonella formicivorans]
MFAITEQMRKLAKELLEKGEVQYIIGWEKGTFWYNSTPVFISKPEEADKLVWDEYCAANLASYLLDDRYPQGKIGIFVKGCDSRGVNRLVQDKQVKRENLFLIGLPCPGMKSAKKAPLLGQEKASEVPLEEKCTYCTHHNPVVYDMLLGEKVALDEVAVTAEVERFAGVEEIEKMTPDEKYEFWTKQYSRCIRCYACRNVCPACNCTVCCFDQGQTWLERDVTPTGNQVYGIIRAFHVAGRCIECGECERVCPMGVPIMKLNRKIAKDIVELFGEYEAGLDTETLPPLGLYKAEDPEEFM